MKAHRLILAAALAAAIVGSAHADLTDSLKKGSIELKTPGPLAFGPESILFVGDLANATIYAIGTGDEAKGDRNAELKFDGLNARVAEMLGATAGDITVNDMKVNPATGNIFFSVARKTGGGLIVKLDRGGKLSELALKEVSNAQVALGKTPKNPTARSPVITAMAFSKNRLFVAGMSNEEFNSSLRSIQFPFKEGDQITAIEIYHGAHGAWETKSPVRTFTPFDINGQAHLLAAYTCTPLVKLPVEELKAGEKMKGITVAELGNQNNPLDMVAYQKDGAMFILIANDRRGVMKVTTDGIGEAEAITTPVKGGKPAGLKYTTVTDLKDVMQLDRLSEKQAVILAKNGDVRSVDLP